MCGGGPCGKGPTEYELPGTPMTALLGLAVAGMVCLVAVAAFRCAQAFGLV